MQESADQSKRRKRSAPIRQTQTRTFEALRLECERRGIKLSAQRKLLLKVLTESSDHPDVPALVERAQRIGSDHSLSRATTYRFLRDLQQIGALERHVFSVGPARYELSSGNSHDHLIEISSGKVIEFRIPEIVALLTRLAAQNGCRLLKYKLEVLVEPSIESTT